MEISSVLILVQPSLCLLQTISLKYMHSVLHKLNKRNKMFYGNSSISYCTSFHKTTERCMEKRAEISKYASYCKVH